METWEPVEPTWEMEEGTPECRVPEAPTDPAAPPEPSTQGHLGKILERTGELVPVKSPRDETGAFYPDIVEPIRRTLLLNHQISKKPQLETIARMPVGNEVVEWQLSDPQETMDDGARAPLP